MTKDYIAEGPAHVVDADWNLLLLTLRYKGVQIDLGGMETVKIYDKQTKSWVLVAGNPATAEQHKILGIRLPVTAPGDMILYKKMIRRVINGVPIDLIDVDAMERYIEANRS